MQEEIDAAACIELLPDFDNSSSLPVVRAIINESMQWRPILSGGLYNNLERIKSNC